MRKPDTRLTERGELKRMLAQVAPPLLQKVAGIFAPGIIIKWLVLGLFFFSAP
jgi:uncharacterized membrane protein YciS (DUF1049 family)